MIAELKSVLLCTLTVLSKHVEAGQPSRETVDLYLGILTHLQAQGGPDYLIEEIVQLRDKMAARLREEEVSP